MDDEAGSLAIYGGDPKHGIIKQAGVASSEAEDCPLWLAFLEEATGGEGAMTLAEIGGTDLIGRRVLAMAGRSLALRGEVVFLIREDRLCGGERGGR